MDNENKNQWLASSNIRVTFVLVGIILAVFLAVKTLSALKELSTIGRGVYPAKVLTVEGKSEVLVKPDIATFTFSVIEEGESVKVAQDEAAKKSNAALAFLKSKGVSDKDIKTVGYNIYPKYESEAKAQVCTPYGCPPSGRQVIYAYEVSQTTEVKLRDLAKAGEILTGMGSISVSNLSGLQFKVDKEDDVMRQARREAINDAREQAKILARSLGVRLGKVVSYSESPSYGPIYGFKAEAAGRGGDTAPSVPPEISPGENKIVSTVIVIFEMR